MKNYLRLFRTKPFLFTAGTIALIVISTSLGVNIFLRAYQARIEEELASRLGCRLSAGSISYSLPNTLILKDLSLFAEAGQNLSLMLTLKKVKTSFSLGRLVTQREFNISNIRLQGLEGQYIPLVSFLKANGARLVELILSLPRSEFFTITLAEAWLTLPREDKVTRRINCDTVLIIERESLSGFGQLGLERLFFPAGAEPLVHTFSPLRYSFKSFFEEGALVLEILEFKRQDFYAKLWGAWKEDVLRLNGFSCVGHFAREWVYPRFALTLKDRLKSAYRRRSSGRIISRPTADFNIFDIDCLIRFSLPRLQIKNLSLSLDNIPLRLAGELVFSNPIAVNLELASYPDQPPHLRQDNPRCFNAQLMGNLNRGEFDGTLVLEFLRKTMPGGSPEKIETLFNNLTFRFTQEDYLRMEAAQIDFAYSTTSNVYKLLFSDFSSWFDFEDQASKLVGLSARLYDGFLQGQGRIDTTFLPFRSDFDIHIRDVGAHQLNSLLIHFSKVYGKLAGQIRYRSYPQSDLSGRIVVRQGTLDGFQFFKWLATSFDLPSLKKVDFDQAAFDFLVNDQVARLENIDLESPQVRLEGNFALQEGDRVASKLSLALSRQLLRSSSKFRPLVKALGRDLPFFVFDFQLSALFDSMNFKWLNSEFKRRLRERIPNFVERGIERKVEAIIGPNPE